MSSVVIPALVVVTAAVLAVVLAVVEPGSRARDKVPTISVVPERGAAGSRARRGRARLRDVTAAVPVRQRRRAASGFALVSLVALLGVVVALGVGAVVVIAGLALKATAG